MIRASLKKPDGSVLMEVDLPSNASEMPLANYISFLNEVRKMNAEEANPILIMARGVSELTGVDIDEILKAKIGEAWMDGDDVSGGIKTMYSWAEKAVEKCMGTIQARAWGRFEYKGEEYTIPPIITSQLSGAELLPGMEVCQAIEVFETIRLFDKEIKKTGDGDGSLVFTQHLRILAILFLKEGEQLPGDDSQREHWIGARAKHFEQIDTQTALDADFFLLNILQHSEKMGPATGFLSLRSLALVMEMQKVKSQNQMPIQKPSPIKNQLATA